MKAKIFLALVICLSALASISTPARADGIIVPEPPICEFGPCPPIPCPGPFPCPPRPPMVQLEIRYHDVRVSIRDQVAVTHVDQVFYNPNDWAVEGTYIFPIPPEAAVASFTLWVDGQPVEGRVLDAEEARRTYEEIVYSLRDPALLEYAGRGALQARVFPIPPGGERRIELEYSQALAAENGLVRYVYPLSTEKFSAAPLERVTINVEVRSQAPVRAVYSPSHEVDISREDDYRFTAGYEASNMLPDTDFALYYSLGEEQAFHLMTFRDPGDPDDPDGFFLVLLAPRPDADARSLPKDLLLVLDRSGSMEGEKFQQAQEALRYVLRNLNPEDRFNIITFSTGIESYASQLRPADEANEAIAWVDRLGPRGSTDINRALLEAAALADRERNTYVIFLTDGLPTEGVIDSQKILDNLAETAGDNLRLFAFGVGYDVDTFLLDSLAQSHHGTSTYVVPGERLDETLSAFYAKISTPVLTDLVLGFGGMGVYDLYPEPLPDLFAGSQIVVVGRYRRGGEVEVTLQGDLDDEVKVYRFPGQVFSEETAAGDERAAIPRLWATRKIGHLLNQVRLRGPDKETIDQIVRLSIRYGIVTPYTSYLVTEDMPLGASEQSRIAGEQYDQLSAMPSAPASGQAAVEKAAEQGAMAEAQAPLAPYQEASNVVRIVGARTFVYSEQSWVDTAFDPGKMRTQDVPFLSETFYRLLDEHPELKAAFALGQRVIAVTDGVAYRVVESDNRPTVVVPLPSSTPAAQPTQGDSARNTPVVDEGQPPASTPPAPGTMPCSSALLSLALVPLIAASRRRR